MVLVSGFSVIFCLVWVWHGATAGWVALRWWVVLRFGWVGLRLSGWLWVFAGLGFRRLWCLSFVLVIVNLVLGVWCLVFGGFCCNADSGLLAGCGFSPGLGGVLVLLVLWGFL